MIKFDVSLFDDLPVRIKTSPDSVIYIWWYIPTPHSSWQKRGLRLRRPKIWNYNGITFCNLWIAPMITVLMLFLLIGDFFLWDCEYSSTLAGAQRIRTLVCENCAQTIRTLVCEKHQLLLVCEFAHWCAKKKTMRE